MSKITDAVAVLALPFAKEKDLFIWDVRFEKQGRDYILQVTLDGDRPVTLDDCEHVSRGIDPLLDEADLIKEAYCLEVSSPGLGRRLYTDKHIELMKGREVTVGLYKAKDGEKDFVGVLLGLVDGEVILENVKFSQSEIKLIKLNDDNF